MMIGIDSNLGFIIICTLIVASYCTIFKVFCNYTNVKSYVKWLTDKEREKTLRCGNGNTIWKNVEVMMIFPMICIPFLLIWSSCNRGIFLLLIVTFWVCIIVHLLAHRKFNVEYYVDEIGIRIGHLSSHKILWENVNIEKEWLNRRRKFQQINIMGKRHILVYPNTEIDDFEESILERNLIKNKYISKSLNEIQKNVLAEQILMIIAVIIIVFCGLYTARSTGHILSEGNKTIDYTKVYYTEQAPYSKPKTIFKSENGYLYVAKEGYAVLNVYSLDGKFLYAYHPPMGFGRGDSEFSVDGSKVYIKNRKNIVFVYDGKKFIGKIDSFKLEDINYIEKDVSEKYSHFIYGDRIFIGYEGVFGILIGVFLYFMASGNINEIWTFLFMHSDKKE